MEIKKIYQYITLCLASLALFSCSNDDVNLISTNFYYLAEESEITLADIESQSLNPTAMAISNSKLYVCNGNEVLVFDAQNLTLLNTIKQFKKGTTEINFNQLTSINIYNGRIYIGTQESRLFILDETTLEGFSVLGNGQWWQTFVHVFGVAVNDDFIFVKEKEQTIKVFETAAVTETSSWNLSPVAKLTTKTGGTENYNLKVENGNLVVAGRNANSFLYYNIEYIKSNAARSLEVKAIEPRISTINSKPIALSFTDEWAVSIENQSNINTVKMYPKKDFMFTKFNPVISTTNAIGSPNFGNITDVVIFNDLLFLSDNTNKKIKILRIKSSTIQEI